MVNLCFSWGWALIPPWQFNSKELRFTPPGSLTAKAPEKWMGGRRSFPFGARYIFRDELLNFQGVNIKQVGSRKRRTANKDLGDHIF